MKLSDISAAIMQRLITEAGTNEFWDETDVKADINWLYRDTAETLFCCKKRDTSTISVVNQSRYIIPVANGVDAILKLMNFTYDKQPVDFYTTEELDILDYLWRTMDAGTPYGCYFERGDENVAVSIVPPPSDTLEVGFDFAFVPSTMADDDIPVNPFTSGIILIDGVMSLELAKPGGGRDLDRSEFWFGQFTTHFVNLGKHKGFAWHGFRSAEDLSTFGVKGVRLPSNYPTYHFD